MTLWPFRRKSRRKWARGNLPDSVDDVLRGGKSEPPPPPRSHTVPQPITETDTRPARQRLNRQSTEPKKLQRRARTYSFSPDRHDSIRVARKRSTKGNPDPMPPALHSAGVSRNFNNKEYGDKEIEGWGAHDEDVFHRIPTLHNKRDGEHLMPRKKSSKKRRKNDHDREAEIKAMSSFVPLRPATDDWTAGRPMKRDTVRSRTGLGLAFRGAARHEWEKENRSSDISLPIPESIHSTMSSDSEHVSYRISALEALAPRPTLRYTVYPRRGPASDRDASGIMRMPSQRRKLSERGPIPEATLKAHKRVDDLADDLNASDLRELMERDQRRRDRRRQRDQEKMERKLAKRAEKQDAENLAAGTNAAAAARNLERGVLGREAVGLGLDPTSAIITSSRRRLSDAAPKLQGKRPERASGDDAMGEDERSRPLDAFHRTTSIPLETSISPPHEPEEPVPPLAPSPKLMGFLQSKKTRSKSPLTSDEKTDVSETLRKGSESSSSKGPLSWTSIFKWANRSNRNAGGGPSSFSNTSRDSMQTNLPLPAPPVNFVPPRKVSTGVPKRTMSRFREDLPELPISPPASRVQSPEAQIIPPTIAEASSGLRGGDIEEIALDSLAMQPDSRHDTPTSGHRSIEEAMRETPSTFSRPDEDGEPSLWPSPEPHTMSLASIDSEGSWLSGRLGRRDRCSSGVLEQHPPRNQHAVQESSSNNSPTQGQDTTGEEVSIVDDEYLSRVTNTNYDRSPALNRKSTGEARPSSDDEEARWGSVSGHLPTVIQSHTAEGMKSREGLLNSFGEEDDESDDGNLTGGNEHREVDESSDVRRATSINLSSGHVRNFSAGSAKLLDLTPRTSVDGKRRSVEPNQKSG